MLIVLNKQEIDGMMMFQSMERREGRKEVNSERQAQIDFSRSYTVVKSFSRVQLVATP